MSDDSMYPLTELLTLSNRLSYALTVNDILKGYKEAHLGAGLLEKPSLIIKLSGSDRLEWLQGLITNDVKKLHAGNSISFCICTPTGQIVTLGRAHDFEEKTLLIFPPEKTENLLTKLNNLIIMEDVVLEDVSPSYFITTLQGPESDEIIRKVFAQPISFPIKDEHISLNVGGLIFIIAESDCTGLGGFDIIGPTAQKNLLFEKLLKFGAFQLLDETYEILRVEAGLPKKGCEITSKVMPPELGKVFENVYVSYQKGCYVGQEVLMRIYSRGHTNRTLASLLIEGKIIPSPGDNLISELHPAPGAVTSAVFSPHFEAPLALAFVRNELSAPGIKLKIEHEKTLLRAAVVSIKNSQAIDD